MTPQKECLETLSFFELNDEGEAENYIKNWERPPGSRIFALDYGSTGNTFTLVRDDCPAQHRLIKVEDFVNLSFASNDDFVIIEYAHMQPRNSRVSLAQPLTYEQLLELKNNADKKNIQIRLISQNLTWKFRNQLFGENSKDDHNDAQALIYAAQHYGLNLLQKFAPVPSKSFSAIQEWAHDQVKEMNEILNLYRMKYDVTESICLLLFEKYALAIELHLRNTSGQPSTDAVRWFFGENLGMDGKTSATLSIWVSLIQWNGSPRLFKDKPIGINNTMRYLLGMRPNHFKGGVARSNIMYFCFKRICNDLRVPDVIIRDKSHESYQKLQNAKSRLRAAIKATMRAMIAVHSKKAGVC